MLLGPVFQAEMVTIARRVRYVVIRVLFAIALLLALWICYESLWTGQLSGGRLSIQGSASLAASFFQAFAWLTLLAAMVVSPAIAAGAIALERERRTIEYLFATDLSNAEIVLSKLAAKLLLAATLLATALPVLAIFRLLGGIPGNLLVVYFAGLGSTVLLLTVGGMCVSVWTARARDAVTRVFLLEIVVFVLPLMAWPLLAWLSLARGNANWLLTSLQRLLDVNMAINPLVVLGRAATTGAGLGVGLDTSIVWRMVYWHLGLTVVLAAVAVAAVRRVHLRAASTPDTNAQGWRQWRLPRWRPALHDRPMLWKELFSRTATIKLGFLGYLALGLILTVTTGIAVYAYYSLIVETATWSGRNLGQEYLHSTSPITVTLSVGTVALMGLRAASMITYEKERDCWWSLLSTPLSGAEIVYAKAMGNLYAFRWMLLPLVAIWLMQATLSPSFLAVIPFCLLVFAATGLFATALGLWFSLTTANSLKAIAATLGVLLFIGGGYLLCCCVPLTVGSSPGGSGEDIMKLAVIPCIPFLHACPMVLWDMGTHDYDWGWILFDYAAGVAGYGAAGILMLANLVRDFDRYGGRVVGRRQGTTDAPPVDPTAPPVPVRPATEAGGEPDAPV